MCAAWTGTKKGKGEKKNQIEPAFGGLFQKRWNDFQFPHWVSWTAASVGTGYQFTLKQETGCSHVNLPYSLYRCFFAVFLFLLLDPWFDSNYLFFHWVLRGMDEGIIGRDRERERGGEGVIRVQWTATDWQTGGRDDCRRTENIDGVLVEMKLSSWDTQRSRWGCPHTH